AGRRRQLAPGDDREREPSGTPVSSGSVDGPGPRRPASGLSRARLRAVHLGEQPAALLPALGGVHERGVLGGHPARSDQGPLRGHRDPARLGVSVKKKRARPTARRAARPATLTARQSLWLELMPFYIREAWLLDERKHEEWLDLFTEDVLYFMPRRKNVPRREAHRELTP